MNYLIICDESQREFFSRLNPNMELITSEEKFETLTSEEIQQFDRIVVCAELSWQNRSISDHYGMHIAIRLRTEKKALAPICILSLNPKEYFDKFNDDTSNEAIYIMLHARGACFLQLPANFNDVETAFADLKPLSPAALTYVSASLTRHLIFSLPHRLRHDADIEHIRKTLVIILEHVSNTSIDYNVQKLSENIIAACEKEDHETFRSLKKELTDQLYIFYVENVQPPNAIKYKVLLLDDNKNDLEWAKKALEPYFDVIPFSDASEAVKRIEDDKKNELTAIICDWLLLEPNSEDHQKWLGFEVLEYASKRGNYALFSLTSTDDFSIREMDAVLGFENHLFTKDREIGDALWNLYVPIIQQKIDKVVRQISSIPTGAAWKNPRDKKNKSYHEQYLSLRNTTDWFDFEKTITERASEHWNYYNDSKFINDEETPNSLGNRKCPINCLENLLVARRIFLALWFSYDKIHTDYEEIAKDNNDNEVHVPAKNKYAYCDMNGICHDDSVKSGTINGFFNRLCIQSELLPKDGMLPEEKAWLSEHKFDVGYKEKKKNEEDNYLVICDKTHKDYFSNLNDDLAFRFITSEEDFEAIPADEFDEFNRIVVFAELLWQGKNILNCYGLHIAVRLRTEKKILAPVCILSLNSKKYFEKLPNCDEFPPEEIKQVLHVRGTCFQQLPCNFSDIETAFTSVEPLSLATLTYVSAQLNRYLVSVLHPWRFESKDEYDNTLKYIAKCVASDPIICNKIQILSKELVAAKDETVFESRKKNIENQLNVYYKIKEREESAQEENDLRSKVLLLDDNINDLNWAKKALEQHFEVIGFSDAKQAIDHVNNDKDNELKAIICDWCLLKPNSKEHQEHIGFEVLEHAAQKGFYALFSLTSTDNFSIREIDAALDIEHQMFTKDFPNRDALWKHYIPIIQQKIDRVNRQVLPLSTGKTGNTGKAWTATDNSYNKKYISAWNSAQWHTFENKIANIASELWKYYRNYIHLRNEIPVSLSDKGIQINSLENLLVARRIFLAVWYSYHKIHGDREREIDSDDGRIYVLEKKLLTYHDLTGGSERDSNLINQFIYRLCFLTEKLPQGILPEEKTWLRKQGFDIN